LGRTYSVLHEVTAQLPDLQFKLGVNRRIHPAFNTEDAIAGGCLLAHVGAIEYWIKSARKSLGEGTTVVATGGYSSDIKPLTDAIDEFDLQLTIKGIDLIAEAAAGPKDRA
jgi:type III pantothenate kinase